MKSRKSKIKLEAVILFSQSEAGWPSCRPIESDLTKIYRRLWGKRCKLLSYEALADARNSRRGRQELFSLSEEISRLAPRRLVFVGHRAHPLPLLKVLGLLNSSELSFYFHLYGNWPLQVKQWQEASGHLVGKKVTFLAPSTATASGFSTLLKKSGRPPVVVPFPVRTAQFYFQMKARQKWRYHLGIRPTEKVVLFVGALRDGKGGDLSRRIVSQLPRSRSDFHFILCGSHLGPSQKWWKTRLEKLHRQLPSRFHHFDVVSQKQLAELMSASDVLLAPSRYPMEAFGMVPIEALSSGLVCLVSDWMGHADLKKRDWGVHFLSVTPSPKSPQIDSRLAAGKLENLFKIDRSPANRKKWEKKVGRVYGLAACEKRLKNMLKKKVPAGFLGFRRQEFK